MAPGLPAHHGAQPRGHIAWISSAVPGIPLSYTNSRGTCTGIDPSHIQRKLISRLGAWVSVSEEGKVQGGMLMSDSHYCRAITTSTSRTNPSFHTSRTSQQTRHPYSQFFSQYRRVTAGKSRKQKQTGR
ncbi:hypothetical protein PoB_000521400 [Plakobranchus ocellatus]|uniref:Uncharacterized protein n=1 Tax=Plakobranchus ocellatus TaxID=259542 RepID=A0AAV3Y8Y4_9GAST|nr:hypothetical protein PoB_000521400 [Plakobranchus ocellatus]